MVPLNPPAPAERILCGRDLQLPLVESVGAIHSRSASRIPWHEHPRFELLLLLEGSTAYEFAGGRSVELPGGHFLVIAPGSRHRGMYDVRRPAQLCGIQFDPRRRQSLANSSFTRRDLAWVAEQCEHHAGQPRPMSSELRRLARSLAKQVRDFDPASAGAAALVRLSACSMLLEAARQLNIVRSIEPNEAARVAIARMEADYASELPIASLTQTVGCSRARLFEVFKQSTGMTPNDYLQRLRVQKAAELLESTDRPVTDIGLACGFTTSQYFSNVFRKYTDTTPSKFRARKRLS